MEKKRGTMNLSAEEADSVANKKLGAEAALNPNAAEFVPFALRSPAANMKDLETSPKLTTSGKSVLDRSESSVLNTSNSEEEAQQYWCHQLPDDITPDFKLMGIDNDANIASRYTSGFTLKEQQASSVYPLDGNARAENLRYPVSSIGECLQTSRDRKVLSGTDQPYNGSTNQAFAANEHLLFNNADLCRLEFLASQFPSFSAESIADAYLSSGGDLNLTINVLTQLELQGDGGSTLSPKAFSTPNLSASSLPPPRVPNRHIGSRKLSGEYQQNVSPNWSPVNNSSRLMRSFSTIPSQAGTEPSIWKYDRNGSSDARQVLAKAYNTGQAKSIYGDRLQSRGSPLTSPARLETGVSFANMYPERREEAFDHQRVHNSYIEQARQAHLAGNNTLAKELSMIGQLHALQLKAANEEAQESIYHQSGTEQMIDLHGLNVSEAVYVLKHKLAVLRNAARSVGQRVLVSIDVGAGHHTWDSPTAARLPAAVQRYLLEEEGLDYSEPRPGLLRVVIY
ncbi:polyadenylate-binding protein-interacting protein 7-like isoform X2 [Salvia hispanica]|uniref:polyadenylate-binding protein-interacting protein 7-like isoform X2 n=1 Tax=Salvia hispanica TaxID=49212 RepID=UPI0020093C8D|nr:polyadenylate-binding protein-interacting protein 7-like isoform X2 [Salvia hispanica]